MSSGYTFTLTDDVMVATTYAMVAYVLAGYLVPWAPARRDVPWWRRRSTKNLTAAVVVCAATLALVLVPNYRTAFGVNISYWDSVGSYKQYGFLPSFVMGVREAQIRRPANYSEFEFLTVISMGFAPANVFPYQTYSLGRVDSLARQFKALGYHTVALHPNLGTNGNRMQNHGGYNLRNTPADILTGYNVDGAGNNDDLNEYLSVIGASDEDLRAFVERLRAIGKPVVLVFFGDHQPGISPAYNDASYPGEEEPGHSARTYQTRYVIWANYDVAGRDQLATDATVCASNLGATLMNAIGAPLSRYQKAELFSTTVVPQISSLGYQAPDGTWHAMSDAQGDQERDLADLRTMFYYEFGSRV